MTKQKIKQANKIPVDWKHPKYLICIRSASASCNKVINWNWLVLKYLIYLILMHLLPKKSPILTYYLLILHNYLAKLTFMAVRGLLYLSKVAIMRKAIGIIRLMPDTTSGSKSFSNTATLSLMKRKHIHKLYHVVEENLSETHNNECEKSLKERAEENLWLSSGID